MAVTQRLRYDPAGDSTRACMGLSPIRLIDVILSELTILRSEIQGNCAMPKPEDMALPCCMGESTAALATQIATPFLVSQSLSRFHCHLILT
jgi:hypothetical protein